MIVLNLSASSSKQSYAIVSQTRWTHANNHDINTCLSHPALFLRLIGFASVVAGVSLCISAQFGDPGCDPWSVNFSMLSATRLSRKRAGLKLYLR
jgi:hypothetical protein